MSSSESGQRETARGIQDRMTARLGSSLTGAERRTSSQIIRAVAPEFHTLHKRIDDLDERLSGKIDRLDERLSGKIDHLSSKLDEVLRAVQSGHSGNST